MIDPHAKLKSYLRLMLLVAILGAVSAVITFVFVALVNLLTELIWKEIPVVFGVDSRLFTFMICIIGGLLVGLLVKIFGDHNAIFSELMQEFGKTGRFDYRHAPGIVITAFISSLLVAALDLKRLLQMLVVGWGHWLLKSSSSMNRRSARWVSVV